MSKFFIEQDTVRVTFPDGEWCDIKAEFTQEDLDYITNQMMKTSLSANGRETPQTEVAMSFGKEATLEKAIVAWSFTDDQGKGVPVTPLNITNLRSKYRWMVLKEIDRVNKEAEAFSKN